MQTDRRQHATYTLDVDTSKACIPRRSEVLLCAVQFVIEEDGHGPEAGKIPPFWGFPHDESDDDSKLTALLFTLVLYACDAEHAALLLCSVIDLSFSVFTLQMSKLSSAFMRHFRDDALGTMRQGQYAGGQDSGANLCRSIH